MLTLIYTTIAATLVAIILVVALRPMAIALRLVDKPDERKHHTGEVPLIGGPVIWLIVTFASIFAPDGFPWGITLAGLALVLLGAFDDRRPISAWFRLFCHLALATVFVLNQNLSLHDIGFAHALYNVPELHWLHTALAIFAIMAAINAFNFIDGIDGLSASMGLLAITHLNLAFNMLGIAQSETVLFYSVIFIGAVSGFLLFNLQVFNGRKIFLGDSGSMFIGLSIAFALLSASQPDTSETVPIPAALCLWIIAIPLTDMTTIIFRRLSSGRSPMAPDRTHLHHILIQAGFSARRGLLVMILSSIAAFWIGFGLYIQFGEPASIIGFFIFIGVYYAAVQRSGKLLGLIGN